MESAGSRGAAMRLKIFIAALVLIGHAGRGGSSVWAVAGETVKNIQAVQFNPWQVTSSARNFAEVEIVPGGQLSLAEISTLLRAPGSDVQVLAGPGRVRIQLPAEQVRALVDAGAGVTVVRRFLLFEGSATDAEIPESDPIPQEACSGDYLYGYSDLDVPIPTGGDWNGSGIILSGVSPDAEVTCIDVHYEINHHYYSALVVELTDEDYDFAYTLYDDYYTGDGDISETVHGITKFNGRSPNQEWVLWAQNGGPMYGGHIDSWWIKVYYYEPFYCNATSTYCSWEYISNVQVGDISNATDCNYYGDYTSMSTPMDVGTGYPITVTNGYGDPADECGIWVDWNQDGDFDDVSETISVSGSPGVGPYTATITPPPTAANGDTRLRIRITDEPAGPCGEYDYGEVEDYTVTVITFAPWIGSGTSEDPYQIWDANDMQAVGADANYWGAHFKLMADIDVSAYTGTSFNIIGNSTTKFTGVFDGNDHRIFNFSYSCNEKDYIGLFGYIDDADSEIRNLGLWGPNIDANDGEYVAALAGRVESGQVINCYIWNGSVSGLHHVGGLVGYNNGALSLCDSKAKTSGASNVGGLVGSNYGQISDGYGTGEVRGVDPGFSGGGLAGYNNGLVDKCYSTGRVYYFNSSLSGGLIGSEGAGGSTINSFWDVNTGLDDSDGGIGKTTEEMQTSSTFTSAGWDFVTPVWTICEGAAYPRIWRPNIKYNGGSGTADDPYLIFTPCQMQQIGIEVGDWDKRFRLMADINLSDYTGTSFNIIGDTNTAFTGVFDGNSHVILNFTYSSSDTNCIGFFGVVGDWRVAADGHIKDLGLINPDVDGGLGFSVGALVGVVNSFGTTISGCFADNGSVWGGSNTGGLVGWNGIGTISNCYASCSVSGDSQTGGLVGTNRAGTISKCYSVGSVVGDDEVGGLVGSIVEGTIAECYSSCSVSGGEFIGGLVGENMGRVTKSYARGSVVGTTGVGGLVGRTWGDIINCYSSGSVTGASDVGGLVGDDYLGDECSNSFWDVNSSGQGTSAGGDGAVGRTTAQMQTESTFTDAGWDFNDIWRICEGENYPKLRWEKYTGGAGVTGDPYLICSAEEMQTIGANPDDWGAHFKLVADIDLGGYTGTAYNIIGKLIYRGPGLFTGTFDGNWHTIYNFNYKTTAEYYIGLFGAVGGPGAEAEIKNLRIVDPNVDVGTGGDAGALVGLWFRPGTLLGCQVIGGRIKGRGGLGAIIGSNMYGNVSRCYSSADVTATTVEDGPTGGLVGINNFGSISQCGTGGSVTSSGNIAGGLVGWNGSGDGVVDCYSTASVTAQEYVGGLVAYNGSAITNSYSVGSVSGTGTYVSGLVGASGGPVTASFWDVNTSGQPGPWAGEGKTTAQMQDPNTFLLAGWDFFGESSNGTEDIWRLCSAGTGYPKLTWQFLSSGDFTCPDGVDGIDLGVLCEEWLLEELSADVWPQGGDGFVNFFDWAIFADDWSVTVDYDDLADFAEQWLKEGATVADIAPDGGDGFVNMADFAALADNWLAGI